MSDDIIEIVLAEAELGTDANTSPLLSSKTDNEILTKIDREATAAGLVRNRDRQGRGAGSYEVWNYLTYSGPYIVSVGVAAAGAAAFVRNTLGAITEWQKLRERRRVLIHVNDKNVSIPDGATEAEVLAAIEDARNS